MKLFGYPGIILLAIGISTADSANLLVPIILTAIGLLLLKLAERRD